MAVLRPLLYLQCVFFVMLSALLLPPTPIANAMVTLPQTTRQSVFGNRGTSSSSSAGVVEDTSQGKLNAALPWTSSINPKRKLAYMPALEAQLLAIQQLNLHCVSIEERFVHQSSNVKPARIGNLCFAGERFRKVRLTYFDAGESVQVFNALWYPSFEFDCPLLGVDLISLGPSRVLSVVDFQPLHPSAAYAQKYIAPLAPIHEKYPDLQGKMSGKFYDDTSFFSAHMLFGRFTNENSVDSVVLPGHGEYLAEYVKTVAAAAPDHSADSIRVVQDRQQAYDTFSASKDPAVGLFDAYFGKEWSHDFVYKFLFDRAVELDASKTTHTFTVNAATGDATILPQGSQRPPGSQ